MPILAWHHILLGDVRRPGVIFSMVAIHWRIGYIYVFSCYFIYFYTYICIHGISPVIAYCACVYVGGCILNQWFMIQWYPMKNCDAQWLSELNRAHIGIIWGHPPAQNQDFCISWTRDSTWLKQWRYSGIQESRQMAQNQGLHATQNLIYVLQLGRWGLHPPRVTKLFDHSNGPSMAG